MSAGVIDHSSSATRSACGAPDRKPLDEQFLTARWTHEVDPKTQEVDPSTSVYPFVRHGQKLYGALTPGY